MDNGLIKFSDRSLDQISVRDWYQITNLRERVFIVEQNCPYLDADGKDLKAHHILGRDEHGVIGAYARIVHPDDETVPGSRLTYLSDQQKVDLISQVNGGNCGYSMPAIGRVVLDPSLRGQNRGQVLMEYTVACCMNLYEGKPVFISAQKPLCDFYSHHGFIESGPGYLEDDIPHIPMILIYE